MSPVLRPEPISSSQRWRLQAGASLIEVLVTILLLMFGLLGVAGLLAKGVSNAASSEAMTKANQLLADMADRIRANSAAAVSATSEYITAYGESIPTNLTSIALRDKKEWLTAVRTQLPLGDGKITSFVSGGARKLEIEVRWARCYGTLTDADQTSCSVGSEGTYQTMKMEIRL